MATETPQESAIGANTTPSAQRVVPIDVVASPEIAGFEAHHLIDDDLSSPWKGSFLDGSEGSATFTFAPAAQLTTISIHNLETDQEAFLRNARVRGVEVSFSDSTDVVVVELPDAPGRQDIRIPGAITTQLTLTITSVYAGEAVGGHDPFDEVAVAEVTFTGPAP